MLKNFPVYSNIEDNSSLKNLALVMIQVQLRIIIASLFYNDTRRINVAVFRNNKQTTNPEALCDNTEVWFTKDTLSLTQICKCQGKA